MRLPFLLLALSLIATPVDAQKAKKTSCFDGPPLVASNVWSHLARYSSSSDFWDGKKPMLTGTYGRCAVKEGALHDPRGRRLARLHCGIEVERRGLIDHLGLEVGALGRRVIERTRNEREELVCTAYTGGSRCHYENKNRDQPVTRYMVSRRLADATVLRGAKAERFFAPQRIRRFIVTMTCH